MEREKERELNNVKHVFSDIDLKNKSRMNFNSILTKCANSIFVATNFMLELIS